MQQDGLRAMAGGVLAHLAAWREKMGLDENAIVLLISTEGDTDPEAYQKILAND